MSSDEYIFGEYSVVSDIWYKFCLHVFGYTCHVALLLSSTMLHAGLVDSTSCIVVAVFNHASCGSCRQYVMYCCCLRPCFVQVLSTVCHVLLLSSTMLRVGLVDSTSCIVVAVFNHASCGSCRQYVMYCCCLRPCFVQVLSTVCHVLLLSSTMLRVGLVDSTSCIVVAVFNHASCGSCRQYVMYCCCLRPCFVQVLSTVCHVLLLSSTMLRVGLVDSTSCIVVAVFNHASCGSCRQYVMYCCCLRPCFVRVLSTVCHVLLLSSTMLRAGLVDSMSCVVAVFDHASCGSCRQYVMYCCNSSCCL